MMETTEASATDTADSGGEELPELPAAPGDNVTADELEAMAGVFLQHASAARAAEAQAESDARRIEADTAAEVERLTRTCRDEVYRLRRVVARDAQAAAGKYRNDHAAPLAMAAAAKRRAAEGVQRGTALAHEHQELTGRLAELDGRLAELDAEQRDLETRLGSAREAGDVDSITTLRARSAAVREAREVLAGQRSIAQARMAALGTDEGTGELFDVLNAVRRDMADARKAINLAFPGRPEAVMDRRAADLQAALGGNLERIAEEHHARQQPRRQAVVRQ
jgi:hypothetical protein